MNGSRQLLRPDFTLRLIPQPPGVQGGDQQRGHPRRAEHVPGGDVHEPVRDLRLRHRGQEWLRPADIIEANFSTPFATIYLLVVSAAIFVCCLSIMAATIRLCFGMARDNTLPVSRPLARVHPTLHTPVWTCIVIAVLAAVPFIKYSGAGIIAIAATGMIYLSYFLRNIIVMRARLRGWPKTAAPFRLGRWGLLVNVVVIIAPVGLIYFLVAGGTGSSPR